MQHSDGKWVEYSKTFSSHIYSKTEETSYTKILNLIGSDFIDLKKTFDLVDHENLLHKLKLYSLKDQACALFSSYLQNRRRIVKVKNTVSYIKNILAGVQQESILGPMIFIFM